MVPIRVVDLEKSFGAVRALSGMSFEVSAGECFGFLGPNGAGKTTTISVLTGQVAPDAGEVSVLGLDPATDPVGTRRRVGILPEQQSPPSFLTPREYFAFVGSIRDVPVETLEKRVELWADRLGFRSKLETLCTDLSRGQQQKVMITQAFLHEPELVFIDEPLVNLDPLVQERVKAFLSEYVESGNTIFVSTHNIDVAEAICTRIGIVVAGRCRTIEEPGESSGGLREHFLESVDAVDDRDLPTTEPDVGDEIEASSASK